MGILKRAYLYLTRKKGRTLILMGILFIMSNFVLTGMALKSASDKEEKKIKESLGSSFIIKSDVDNSDNYKIIKEESGGGGSMYNGALVTDEMIKKIVAINGVSDYAYSYDTSSWVDLHLIPAMYTADCEEYKKHPEYLDDIQHKRDFEDAKLYSQVASIVACENEERYEYFRTGACTLARGRHIESGDKYKAVISISLAEQNGLSIGDSFRIETREATFKVDGDPKKVVGDPMELEIVGLFDIDFKQEYSIYTAENAYVENLIFTDWITINQLQAVIGYPTIEEYMKVTFFVDDPKKLDGIINQIKSNEDIDLADMIIKPDNSDYKASVKPLRQIGWFALFLLAGSIVGCMIILFLLLNMWGKSRKNEVRTLVTVGLSQREILLQLLTESIVIAMITLGATFALSGVVISGVFGIAEQMISSKAGAQAYILSSEKTYILPQISKAAPDHIALDYHLSITAAFILITIVVGILLLNVIVVERRMIKKMNLINKAF